MLRYLKTFLEAARLGSFSVQATVWVLTQSAVSSQIRRLEQDLGLRIV